MFNLYFENMTRFSFMAYIFMAYVYNTVIKGFHQLRLYSKAFYQFYFLHVKFYSIWKLPKDKPGGNYLTSALTPLIQLNFIEYHSCAKNFAGCFLLRYLRDK